MVQFISEIPWQDILKRKEPWLLLSIMAGLGMGHVISRFKAFSGGHFPRINR